MPDNIHFDTQKKDITFLLCLFLKKGGRRGSNPRPSVPQTDTLTN